ncbi:MAG: hypothetical protein LH606_03305 [Cytophagaceae bacterium]|nr:hypothetical protein [Cytophagaceae bacterium]
MNSKRVTILAVLLAVVPILVFYAFYWRYAVNVPFQDDFDAIFGSLLHLLDAQSPGEYLRRLTEQDDEHRIGFVRIVTRLLYAVQGEVDFRSIGLVGNLMLLGFLGLFWRSLRVLGYPVIYLLPVVFFLFQIQYHEGIFWGMIPCQNFAVLLFAFSVQYALSRGTGWGFAVACGLGLLATFTNSNGMMAFLPGLLILAWQRHWGRLWGWAGVMAVCFWLYLHDLVIPAFRPKLSDNLRDYPGTAVLNFFSFIGQFVDPGAPSSLNLRLVLVVAVGVGMAVWFGGLLVLLGFTLSKRDLFRRWANRLATPSGLFWVGSATFILITALIFAVGRAANGLEAPLTSRYKLNVALLMCLLYLTGLVLLRTRRRLWFGVLLTLSVLAWAESYLHYTDTVAINRKEKLLDLLAWRNTRTLPTSPIYLTPVIHAELDTLFITSIRRGLYRFPKAFYTSIEPTLLAPLTTPVVAAPLTATVEDLGEFLLARNTTFLAGTGLDDGAYLILKAEPNTSSVGETHVFNTHLRAQRLHRVLRTGRLYAPGFVSVSVLKASLSVGTYRVGWLVVRGLEKTIGYTDERILVEKSLKTRLSLTNIYPSNPH